MGMAENTRERGREQAGMSREGRRTMEKVLENTVRDTRIQLTTGVMPPTPEPRYRINLPASIPAHIPASSPALGAVRVEIWASSSPLYTAESPEMHYSAHGLDLRVQEAP